MTSAITNRQSMAIVMATRIQDDFSSNHPHLPCVGTAQSPGPIFRRCRFHTRKESASSLHPGLEFDLFWNLHFYRQLRRKNIHRRQSALAQRPQTQRVVPFCQPSAVVVHDKTAMEPQRIAIPQRPVQQHLPRR